jgi:hypothetical protein
MDSDKRLQILSRRFGPRVAAAILGIDVEDVVEFRNDPQPLPQIDTGARLLQRNADLAITAETYALTWERNSVGSYSGLEAPAWQIDLLERRSNTSRCRTAPTWRRSRWRWARPRPAGR